jgi:hypothetical protein
MQSEEMLPPDEIHLRKLLEGEDTRAAEAIRSTMNDPKTSAWVKSNLLHLLECDPVQAMFEVNKLHTICRERVLRPRPFPKKNPKPV